MVKLLMSKGQNEAVYLDEQNFGIMAEKLIEEYRKDLPKNKQGELAMISKSKIRGILELVNKIYNDVFYIAENELNTHQISDIAYLKVKLAYEYGREDSVAQFIKKTRIMDVVDQIKTKDDFLLYARYVESLIAYFKFHGGRDN